MSFELSNQPSRIDPATLSPEMARYHRQMLLPGFGEQGQKRLMDSTALVLGCGALGTVIVNMLARAGVGHIIVADRDFIEMTNLQRQVLFDEQDVADLIPKAQAAKAKIAKINSQVKITALVEQIDHTNIERLAGIDNPEWAKVDVIMDGVDNFETRYVANDCAVKHGIPYVYGGSVGTVGASFAVMPHTDKGDTPWEQTDQASPCLRCIYEQAPPPGINPTCDTAGVIGPAVSITANYQVTEALKILTGNLAVVNPAMLSFDLYENTFRQLKIKRAYDIGECICCKQRKFEFLEGAFASQTTTICGRNAVQISPKGGDKLDFSDIQARLQQVGKVRGNKFMLVAEVIDANTEYEITLFTDGRAIVKGTKEPNVAMTIYGKYIGG